jgi:hypothetical protein
MSGKALQSWSEVPVRSAMRREAKVRRIGSSCHVRKMTNQESLVKSYSCGIRSSLAPASNIPSPKASHACAFFHSTGWNVVLDMSFQRRSHSCGFNCNDHSTLWGKTVDFRMLAISTCNSQSTCDSSTIPCLQCEHG